MFGVGCFGLVTRVIIETSTHPTQETLTDFHGDKAKKKTEKKVQNGRLKKTEFFKTANSQYFFAKIS